MTTRSQSESTRGPRALTAVRVVFWATALCGLLTGAACANPPGPGKLAAVWVNDGADKVHRGERRAVANARKVHNPAWDGGRIKVAAARNEVVAFALVLEAGDAATGPVDVRFDRLTGPGGAVIRSAPASGDGVFNWVERPIELFLVEYLPIEGLSRIFYDSYDERHVPARFRRPFNKNGDGRGGWVDRPERGAEYPDIATPLELRRPFTVAAQKSQTVWIDVHVPRTAPPGLWRGAIEVVEAGAVTREIPVELTVRGFTLPDTTAARTMLVLGYSDLGLRYLGERFPDAGPKGDRLKLIRDRHFHVARRHRITLTDQNEGPEAWPQDAPRPEWQRRLNGTLYTPEHGYDGPGVGIGDDLFVIGLYGSWDWKEGGEAAMHAKAKAWASWFTANQPATEYFLYLIDESDDYASIEKWSRWISSAPPPGNQLTSFATLQMPKAVRNTPSLQIAASRLACGDTATWTDATNHYRSTPGKRLYMYNGVRPGTGSFAVEDEGVSLTMIPWAQYKLGIHRWFFWESTYYTDFQGGRGDNDVWRSAHTFGGKATKDPVFGETGWNYGNGDGLLFYPGRDLKYPGRAPEVDGPIASLRLKHWRRGIQDVEYLRLAESIDPTAVKRLVQRMVPKSLWEYGVNDRSDPNWVRTDVSWSTNPADWNKAREELAAIIERGASKQKPAP